MSVDHSAQAGYSTPEKSAALFDATASTAGPASPAVFTPPVLKRDLMLRLQSLKLSLQEKEQQRRAIFDQLDKIHYTSHSYLPLHDRRRLLSKAMLDDEYELIVCERELEMRENALILVEEAELSRDEGLQLTHSCINEVPEEEEESLIRKSEVKRMDDHLQDSGGQGEEGQAEEEVGVGEQNGRKSRRKVYKYLQEEKEGEVGESGVRRSRTKVYRYHQESSVNNSHTREQYLSEILQMLRDEQRQKQLLIHSHYRLQ